jgi:ribonuclease HI
LVFPAGKIHNLSYRLEFDFTNNVTKFEDLLLGIENTLNLGCVHLSVFGDSELVVNLIHKICSLSKKMMERYSQTFWALISNLLSLNITHVKRDLNSMAGRLAVFAASPNQQLLPHRPNCYFQSLYRPYIPDNVESWQALPNNKNICAFIQDEPLNLEEIISIENSKIPESLTPLDGSFSLSVVGNKEKKKEEELRMKVGETISSNIGALESPKNDYIDT